MIPAAKTKGSAKSIIASLSLSVIGIVGSSHLLLSHGISEVSFLALCGLSVLIGFLIFWSDRIVGVNFKSLSVDLARVEEARIEVEAKREEIEKLAYLTVRLVVASQEAQVTFGMTEEVEAEFRSAAKDILLNAGVDPADELYAKIDNINRENAGII